MSHIQTAPHELTANLIYDNHGVSPYWALRRLIDTLDGGVSGIQLDIDGETWDVSLSYQDSGLAPRPTDDVEQLYEYRLTAYGDGQRKAPFLIQPRWPHLETTTGDPVSTPENLGEAVNVRIDNGVNIHPSEYPTLLSDLLSALARKLDLSWNPHYFAGPLHDYSNIVEYEVYVRLLRDMGVKLARSDGIFHRLFHLTSTNEGSAVVYEANNEDILGYRHQLRLDHDDVTTLVPGRAHGAQFKLYHPKHVRESTDTDDPLAHPKVGVLFKKNLNPGTVAWHRHHDLERELEELLVNFLSWGDIPTKPGTCFVPDTHFTDTPSTHDVAFYDDPTPDIEQRQDSILIRSFTALTDSDEDLLEALVTDGGAAHYQDLADTTGYSISTVYRFLTRLHGLIESDNGTVQFVSRKLLEDVSAILEPIEQQIDYAVDSVAHLLDMDRHQIEQQGSAWQQWLNTYAVDVVDNGDHLSLKVRATLDRLRSTSCPRVSDVLMDGLAAWRDAGLDPHEFTTATVSWQTPHGGTEAGVVSTLLR